MSGIYILQSACKYTMSLNFTTIWQERNDISILLTINKSYYQFHISFFPGTMLSTHLILTTILWRVCYYYPSNT